MIGPKPRWEYRKIELLNELNGEIQKEAEKNGCNLSRNYTVDMPDLDRNCDPMNVHGWIQNILDLVEGNFAGLCEEIIHNDSEALHDLKDIAYRFGYKHAADTVDPLSAYQLVDDVILNGMPCDDVNVITRQTEDEITWYEKQDMHEKYWNDEKIYRVLRNEVIRGLLAKSPVNYSYNDNQQSIVRNQAVL